MFLSSIDRLSKQKINNDIKDLNINWFKYIYY
jgi:hypothetical protein